MKYCSISKRKFRPPSRHEHQHRPSVRNPKPSTSIISNHRGIAQRTLKQSDLNQHLLHIRLHIGNATTSEGTGQFLDHMPTVLQLETQHLDLTFQRRDLLLQIHHRLPQLGVLILQDCGSLARRRRPSRALRLLVPIFAAALLDQITTLRFGPIKTRGSDTTSHEAPPTMMGKEHRVASCPQHATTFA
ncbi:UNVERIFIED_CONTAM: hypothetical protein Sradi_2087500 [Sesamum radiatum]|uniref:Uncharacterized protein n=1 Tax=Sesamum radiatum TaxID=300843 RepID=A0AAW2TJG6_SESRA